MQRCTALPAASRPHAHGDVRQAFRSDHRLCRHCRPVSARARRRRPGHRSPDVQTTAEFAYIEHLLGFAFQPQLGPTGYRPRRSARARKPFRTPTATSASCRTRTATRATSSTSSAPEFENRCALLFASTERVRTSETLYELIEAEAPKRSTAKWVEFCDAVEHPLHAGAAVSSDLPDDPHMKAVDMFRLCQHPSEGSYKSIRAPVTFGINAVPGSPARAATRRTHGGNSEGNRGTQPKSSPDHGRQHLNSGSS